jgi:hypothetical protein
MIIKMENSKEDLSKYDTACIYQMYFKEPNKSYVGQAQHYVNGKQPWGGEARAKTHVYEAFNSPKDNCTVLNSAIRKYGIEGFDLIILEENIPNSKIDEREEYYIKTLNTIVPNGYNLRTGGANGKITPEAKLYKRQNKNVFRIYRKFDEDYDLPPFISPKRSYGDIIGYRVSFQPQNSNKNIIKDFYARFKNAIPSSLDAAKEYLTKLKLEHNFTDEDKKYIIKMTNGTKTKSIIGSKFIENNEQTNESSEEQTNEFVEEYDDEIINDIIEKPNCESIVEQKRDIKKVVPTEELPHTIKPMLRSGFVCGYKVSYPIPGKRNRHVKQIMKKDLSESLEVAKKLVKALDDKYKNNDATKVINIMPKSSAPNKSNITINSVKIEPAKAENKKPIVLPKPSPIVTQEDKKIIEFLKKCVPDGSTIDSILPFKKIAYDKAQKQLKKIPANCYPLFAGSNIIGFAIDGLKNNKGILYPRIEFKDLSSNVKNLGALKRHIAKLQMDDINSAFVEPEIPDLKDKGVYDFDLKRTNEPKLPKYMIRVYNAEGKQTGYKVSRFILNGELHNKSFCDPKATMKQKFNDAVNHLRSLWKQQETLNKK